MNESLILYKLIILYMLDRVTFPLTNSQITECILEKEYTTYFIIQQSFSELIDTKLIVAERMHHSSHYTLTDEGKKTLAYYRHIIPDGVIEGITDYLTKHKIELKNKVSVVAHYEPLKDQDYAVHFKIKEQNADIFNLTLHIPSEEIANRMCNKWQEKHEELYSYIMEKLAFTDSP